MELPTEKDLEKCKLCTLCSPVDDSWTMVDVGLHKMGMHKKKYEGSNYATWEPVKGTNTYETHKRLEKLGIIDN